MTINDYIAYVESHMEIHHATQNGAYRSGRVIYKHEGCVNHSVGCAQPKADVFFNAMNTASAQWGVNAILGDFHQGEGRILVTLDMKARPWGCGAGKKGSWNNTKIQWEVCEPAGHTYAGGTMVAYDTVKNQAYFDRMWKMLVAWNVYCVVKLGYPLSGISDHAESYRAGYGSNHSDMDQWLPKHGKSMDALRKEVQAILENEEEEDMDQSKFNEMFKTAMTGYRKELQDNDSGEWSKEAREWAVEKGLFVGNGTTVEGDPNMMWEDGVTREQYAVVSKRLYDIIMEAVKDLIDKA